ncbi:MAG TPA: hypothetical protein VJ652_12605 [Noviherbaspirillum sp.]|nr:hypothetical protein [Noviherbaspirillum sp.]
MKTINALVLLIASAAVTVLTTAPALAQNSAAHAAKKAHAKKSPAKVEHDEDDEKEPDITGLQPIEFHCELGNNLTIYRSANDDQQIALRWNKRLHNMMRVATTTGANRFENAKKGLVWIGIPAKGILLDSKKGHQLANECKSSEQALR